MTKDLLSCYGQIQSYRPWGARLGHILSGWLILFGIGVWVTACGVRRAAEAEAGTETGTETDGRGSVDRGGGGDGGAFIMIHECVSYEVK
jgi:hypothetical protein